MKDRVMEFQRDRPSASRCVGFAIDDHVAAKKTPKRGASVAVFGSSETRRRPLARRTS